MKLLTLLAPLLAGAVAVDALALWGEETKQSHLLAGDDDKKIPGLSPLEHCTPDFAGDILSIEHINLSPNPPLA